MSCRRFFRDILPITFNRQSYSGKRCFIYMCRTRFISTAAFGLTTTRVSHSTVVPWVLFCRLYRGQNTTTVSQVWRKRSWRVIRGIFLTTGAVVWAVALFAYVSLEKVSVDVQGESDDLGSDLSELERKLMSYFYKEKDEAGIMRKDEALYRVWSKLNQESRIKDIFGYPVYICGYNYSSKIKGVLEQEDFWSTVTELADNEAAQGGAGDESRESEVEDDKKWEAGCYIEGSKNLGLLKVVFEEHKHEWVPVALHLEMLEKSGEIVTDVSASLPNGIKNFTRLTNI